MGRESVGWLQVQLQVAEICETMHLWWLLGPFARGWLLATWWKPSGKAVKGDRRDGLLDPVVVAML